MTEQELATIEARVEAELAVGGWGEDEEFVLLRDEVPRLIAEVRRLGALVQAYRDGLAVEDDEAAASRILHAAIDGRPLPVEELATPILDELEGDLQQTIR